MTLYGKGFYLWQIWNVEGGNAAEIAAKAENAGLSHILIKIADGPSWAYNYDYDRKVDLIPPVRDALREAGLQVWGWHYVRGDDPLGEARLAVDRTNSLGLDGYVIDAEKEYKESGKKLAAHRFVEELRAGLPELPIALSTYRYPHIHPNLPYETFLERCDYAMPQVYFEQAHNPELQLERTIEHYMNLTPARPIIPTGPTYSHAGWRPRAEEVTRFLQRAQELGLTAVNFWAMDFAIRTSMHDLWDAVAQFDWPAKPPLADMPERLIGRMNQRDPAHVAGLYHHNAAHGTGARTVVGIEGIEEWYHVLFSQLLPNATFEMTGKSGTGNSRHFTWTAASDHGVVMDGNDTLGLRDGRIQYHYTYFTIT